MSSDASAGGAGDRRVASPGAMRVDRYELADGAAVLARFGGASAARVPLANLDVRPEQRVPVILAAPTLAADAGMPERAAGAGVDGRAVALVEWGLVFPGARTVAGRLRPGTGVPFARAEDLLVAPGFRDLLAAGRCLIPATAVFARPVRPVRDDGRRPSYRVARRDGAPFALAGLWAAWENPARWPPAAARRASGPAGLGGAGAGESGDDGSARSAGEIPLRTCALITRPSRGLLAPYAARMPALLRPEDEAAWLAPWPETDTPDVSDGSGLLEQLRVLEGYPEEELVVAVVPRPA